MKLQSDWLIQMTEKIRGPDSRDEYEVLDWPAGKMNIDGTYMYMIIERGGNLYWSLHWWVVRKSILSEDS